MAKQPKSAAAVEDVVAHLDTGPRNPGGWQGQMSGLPSSGLSPSSTSLRLYLCSQQATGLNLVVNNANRFIHLAFTFLASVAFPLFKPV